MFKDLLQNKKRLVIAIVVLLLVVVCAILLLIGQSETDKQKGNSGEKIEAQDEGAESEDKKESSDSRKESNKTGGLEVVKDGEQDSTPEDSVKAPASWSNPEKETTGDGASSNQQQNSDKTQDKEQDNNQQDDKQDESGISDEKSFGDKDVPFGRIF